ncbi:hypothetical protein Pdw03_1824 [Penicillium digitatum]|uniref:Uncharacterized protein n=3 Tax=Penicillium digitatum TaxID=36651 RepID=K9F960_PEND2|nr:hypothetical protein PDIP_29760 [Penicillium digitatum Pd1]EKV05945.1 hypothetical protein PDIG_81420 [Penicillium digitatum PHI26]EKV17779.1 hypothetical protein PDIP_29760 [Penicillium digitatum Pd1]KAG0155164.1 hypothetical protein PDIDSM_737 [Penicillium digitatum]QQK46926.1 hypothetical protein Pdw03_1824 [Penicillium digitatum]
MADGFNQARAMRVAEIINDYRTLLLHISQQQVEVSQEEYWEDGFVVLRESLASAQTLMSANYQPCPVTGQGDAETEKTELQRVILDSSARRFQAHKIYLRAAAARRWAITRASVLRDSNPTVQLKSATATLHQDLARFTDQHVVADLRAADLRAGHWLDEDPSLEAIHRWIGRH